MLYSKAITEILSRIDDPNGDTYKDRAEQLFRDSIINLALSSETNNEDILVLLKVIDTNLNDVGIININTTLGSDLLKILKIFSNPNAFVSKNLFIETDLDTWSRIGTDETLEPFYARKEILWCPIAGEIHFYNIAASWYGNNPIKILILNRPAEFTSSYELIGNYSEYFIDRVIDLSTIELKKEIKMES